MDNPRLAFPWKWLDKAHCVEDSEGYLIYDNSCQDHEPEKEAVIVDFLLKISDGKSMVISTEEYISLLESQKKLDMLEGCGVDN